MKEIIWNVVVECQGCKVSSLCGLIVPVRVVPRRTAAGDVDGRFDSHHQSQLGTRI